MVEGVCFVETKKEAFLFLHLSYIQEMRQNFIEVKEITYKETLSPRRQWLRPFLTESQCVYPGDLHPDSFHLGAFSGDKLVGIASFFKEGHEALQGQNPFRLRQMASAPSFRNKGVGRQLILVAKKMLKERQSTLLWCHARQEAFGFYEKMGFLYYGPLFHVPQIGPHKIMYLLLKTS
ncbi:MAG: GNAT family N-acetyltransferase [Bdellovibrio sp.]|nr:MAG: GNAT family N-acetyltransferase [Bdellovibrio sp.]